MKNQIFEINAKITCQSSVVGSKEHQGPIGNLFDIYDTTNKFKQKTWEKAERDLAKQSKAITVMINQEIDRSTKTGTSVVVTGGGAGGGRGGIPPPPRRRARPRRERASEQRQAPHS